MNRAELKDYLDEKNAFKAMCKEIDYQSGNLKEKEKEYKENYMKSFIANSDFKTETLREFKKNV